MGKTFVENELLLRIIECEVRNEGKIENKAKELKMQRKPIATKYEVSSNYRAKLIKL